MTINAKDFADHICGGFTSPAYWVPYSNPDRAVWGLIEDFEITDVSVKLFIVSEGKTRTVVWRVPKGVRAEVFSRLQATVAVKPTRVVASAALVSEAL